jgi:hypothetical protein
VLLKSQANGILSNHNNDLRLTQRVTRATLPGKVESENGNSGSRLFERNCVRPLQVKVREGLIVEPAVHGGNT